MTDLKKPVTRRTRGTVFERGERRILVTLEPGDMLGLRLERTRRTYRARLSDLFRVAVSWEADAEKNRFNRRLAELRKAGHSKRDARRIARQELGTKHPRNAANS
jgi:hypothetical protein